MYYRSYLIRIIANNTYYILTREGWRERIDVESCAVLICPTPRECDHLWLAHRVLEGSVFTLIGPAPNIRDTYITRYPVLYVCWFFVCKILDTGHCPEKRESCDTSLNQEHPPSLSPLPLFQHYNTTICCLLWFSFSPLGLHLEPTPSPS